MKYMVDYFLENKLAHISRESGTKVTISWSPTIKEQLIFTEHGVRGQFIVQYDVDHKSTPNQVLVSFFLKLREFLTIHL